MKKIRCLTYISSAVLLIYGCGAPPANEHDSTPAESGQIVNSPVRKATVDPAPTQDKSETSAAAATFDGTAGIVEKKSEWSEAALLTEVRYAGHGEFDRVVFQFAGDQVPGYHIEYIDKPVHSCGSGEAVPIAGDGWLEVRFSPARAYTETGQPTVGREFAPNLEIIREIKSTCDFEADLTWVVGVASPNKYRVIELKDPARLAVDVKH